MFKRVSEHVKSVVVQLLDKLEEDIPKEDLVPDLVNTIESLGESNGYSAFRHPNPEVGWAVVDTEFRTASKLALQQTLMMLAEEDLLHSYAVITQAWCIRADNKSGMEWYKENPTASFAECKFAEDIITILFESKETRIFLTSVVSRKNGQVVNLADLQISRGEDAQVSSKFAGILYKQGIITKTAEEMIEENLTNFTGSANG